MYEDKSSFPLKKVLVGATIAVVLLLVLTLFNPWSINDASQRTVVQRVNGEQLVQFKPGIYYAGFWAKETPWPNQISVTYQAVEADLDFKDNGIEIGQISIMFSDGTKADVKGITQYVLPSTEEEMILIHNTHRTPESLVTKRLSTFTKECLQSSASLLSSDKHYGGGRTQMSQNFLDQLKNGVYLAEVKEKTYVDSLDKETKRLYVTQIKTDDKTKQPLRKASAIAEYGISVADASIIDTDYEDMVDNRRNKIIEAATATALSRQTLMKAQQEALTKKAEGEKDLVEIEYTTKKDQTKQVVEAQTRVEVAKQNKLEQQIAYEKALIEVKERQAKADVAAYEKRTTIQANGALELKLQAWVESQKYWADALKGYQGNIVPTYQTGGAAGANGATQFMEIMGAKAARDLSLDLRVGNRPAGATVNTGD